MSLATKPAIRQHYRQLRRAISPSKKIITAQALTKIFMDNAPFDFHQKNIAVYLASDDELDLQFLIRALWEKQSNLFLPVITRNHLDLQFAPYFSSTLLKKNQYGISEPVGDTFISRIELDMVLMPLVAFDKIGTRIGMGKGYYDKTFSFLHKTNPKLKRFGIAYECQYCENLPADPWDVPLDGVITEKRFLLFNETI